MPQQVLMKGNEAIGEGAILAGCRHYFGYPITPQSELIEYMAKRLPEAGGVFLQAESEIAAINMVYGASAAGARVMTSSSSPGISLKQEGISYMAGAELGGVIVNITRGGPGLGSIQPGQADYFQSTRGGGHGDYRTIALAPNSVQEMVDITVLAFDLADKYRNPVMIIGDGALGQMMEPVSFQNVNKPQITDKPWAATGLRGRAKSNIITSLHLDPELAEKHNIRLTEKYDAIFKNEQRFETMNTEDAELILVAYGICARIAQSAMFMARGRGLKVGLIRPVTLWPFPQKPFADLAPQVNALMTLELSAGQMIDDVRLAVNGAKPVSHYGRTGGMIPSPKEVLEHIEKVILR